MESETFELFAVCAFFFKIGNEREHSSMSSAISDIITVNISIAAKAI